MSKYRVAYIHPTSGEQQTVTCDDTRLNVVAGVTFFVHCDTYDRCHIIAVSPSPNAVRQQIDKYMAQMNLYMDGGGP